MSSPKSLSAWQRDDTNSPSAVDEATPAIALGAARVSPSVVRANHAVPVGAAAVKMQLHHAFTAELSNGKSPGTAAIDALNHCARQARAVHALRGEVDVDDRSGLEVPSAISEMISPTSKALAAC